MVLVERCFGLDLCQCGFHLLQRYGLPRRAITFMILTANPGRQAKISNLWAFVALAEILPISFAQNLFYLALLGSTSNKNNTKLGSGWTWLLSGLGYIFCLLIAPNSGQSLILIILVARLLLALPLFMPTYSSHGDISTTAGLPKVSFSIFAILSLVAFGTVAWASQIQSLTTISKELNSHPAVSALGYDFIVSCMSWALWFAADNGDSAAVTYVSKHD